MKIAYLTSQYPAVSHTFIMREVLALRDIGFDIGTFSIRRATSEDCLDMLTQKERDNTRWLLPPGAAGYARACAWAALTRPLRSLRTLTRALMLGRGSLKWVAYFLEAVQLARWLEQDGFGHLHCHFGNAGSSTGMLAAALAGVPFSITCHGSALRDIDKHRLANKLSAAAFIACVTYFGKVQLMMACPPKHWPKLEVVRCGVPQPVAADSQPSTETASPPHILCVGRLSREKGHIVLLEALASLRDEGIPFRCTLIGDGPLRAEVEHTINRLRLSNFVTMTGSLAPEAVANHYANASVVVLSSFSEGAPVVLMEAMAYGCPVVATNVGGVSELIEHGRTGTLVAPGDPAALATAIRNVLRDPTSAAAMAVAAKRHVTNVFNVEQSAKQLARLFECAAQPERARGTIRDTEASPC